MNSRKLSNRDAVVTGSDALVQGLDLNMDQLDDHDNEVAMISKAHIKERFNNYRKPDDEDEDNDL